MHKKHLTYPMQITMLQHNICKSNMPSSSPKSQSNCINFVWFVLIPSTASIFCCILSCKQSMKTGKIIVIAKSIVGQLGQIKA